MIPTPIIVFMCFNGLFQSTGFPACVTILGNWINKKTKGRIYGIWSSCHNIGNIIGLIFGMLANDSSTIGWQFSILFASIFMAINTGLIATFVVSNPGLAGFQLEIGVNINKKSEIQKTSQSNLEEDMKKEHINFDEKNSVNSEEKLVPIPQIPNNNVNNENNFAVEMNSNQIVPEQKSLNPLRVCLVPGVFFYAVLNTFIKTVVISLLFWLPYYLKQQKLDRHAANIAVLFEFGQIIGAFLLGYLCDKLHKRASIITPALLINIILFVIVSNLGSKEDLFGYYFTLFLIGILLGGPANLIAAMTSHDISHNPEIKKKNKKIAATLVGIIDGSAYIGVSLAQLFIPYLVGELFLFMMFFFCFSLVWISPLALKEIIKESGKTVEIDVSNEINENKDHLN